MSGILITWQIALDKNIIILRVFEYCKNVKKLSCVFNEIFSNPRSRIKSVKPKDSYEVPGGIIEQPDNELQRPETTSKASNLVAEAGKNSDYKVVCCE